jgi:SAM-dependent methyltransferase
VISRSGLLKEEGAVSGIEEDAPQNRFCPCCNEQGATKWMEVPDHSQQGAGCYELFCCVSCHHVWLNKPPAPDEMGYYYGPQYHRDIGRAGETSPARWKRQLRVIQRYKSGGHILDVGCSSGGFLAYIKGASWGLNGIEASSPTAERARAITGGNIVAGDVMDAVFPPGSMDVITCSDVLEHLYEPQDVIRRISSWLKPGGIFYVFVPNIMSWEARAFRSYWYGLDLPRHLHHFSIESLAALASSANLRQVRMVTPAGSYLEHSASIWLDSVLRRNGLRRTPVPLNLVGDGGIAWRAVRKGVRISIEALYSRVASVCGSAPSIQAVFRKDDGPELVGDA